MTKNTELNRLRLAQHVVDGWDLDDLMSFAVTTLCVNYKDSPEQFDDDVELYEFQEQE
tara:strand:- start:797 stop:970 length:174 start_codon:yes stop_codon:yes gene_type:complete